MTDVPMNQDPEQKFEVAMSAKDIKKKYRASFQQFPEKYYPVEFFKSINFVRRQCEKCNNFFWNLNPDRKLCGDSNCVGAYSFIGKKNYMGIDKKFTLAEAWQTFEDAFTTQSIPCKRIDRYPVVARWRNDVDFVQAGIYCFQPYCVVGEMKAPANPLICPQFCVRFNDLDNIGLTGRHYSGFVMIGIQVFNLPGEYKFFKDECVAFNYRWLTEFLKIPPEEICFSEDIWAGGGNMGPCVEYFVHGMELGNMVFMQYKTFHDGSIEPLKITVIDTGIGLERVAWLINGDSMSYMSAFRRTLAFLTEKLNVQINDEVWTKLAPYSTRLDVDECEDLDKTWQSIAELVNMSKDEIYKAIEPLRNIFIILDHTRSILFLIKDGSLPSNVGGGFNLRNLIRRCFAILEKFKWWDVLKMDGFMEIFEHQEKDIEDLYGKFPEYQSFRKIIELEFERYQTTDNLQNNNLKSLLKKTKGVLTIKDWYTAVTSWGMSPEKIQAFSNLPIPDNLYYYIDSQRANIVKASEQILYDTTTFEETVCLYFDHLKHLNEKKDDFKFTAKIQEVLANVLENNKRNVLILNQTCFYPNSGGQANDDGHLLINGEKYNVVNVEKVGKCVLHILDKEVPQELIGASVEGFVNEERRKQLRNHHTAAHIIFASCRGVLGPHVWQAGAKKTVEKGHLDITHYEAITDEQQMQIEELANTIVMDSKKINKTLQLKDEAEKVYGFSLYQGGVVPGNELRVVQIDGLDTEACCGTHCDSTSEVGWIKITSTKKISDGIVRLFFVAGKRVLQHFRADQQILNDLCKMWSVNPEMLVEQGQKFFKGYKKFQNQIQEQNQKLFQLSMKQILSEPKQFLRVASSEENPSLYFSNIGKFAEALKASQKNVAFVSKNFYYVFFSKPGTVDEKHFQEKYKEAVKILKNAEKVKDLQIISVNIKGAEKEFEGDFKDIKWEVFQ